MDERDDSMDALGEFADWFNLNEAPSEEQAQAQAEEHRSLASSLFEKIRGLFGKQAEQEEALQEQPAPEASSQEDASEEELPFAEDAEEQPQEEIPQISDSEIMAAAQAAVNAIRQASDEFGVEFGDERALELAMMALAQATSLEQLTLLAYGLVYQEAKKQGTGVRRSQQREYEQSEDDTLSLFVKIATGSGNLA